MSLTKHFTPTGDAAGAAPAFASVYSGRLELGEDSVGFELPNVMFHEKTETTSQQITRRDAEQAALEAQRQREAVKKAAEVEEERKKRQQAEVDRRKAEEAELRAKARAEEEARQREAAAEKRKELLRSKQRVRTLTSDERDELQDMLDRDAAQRATQPAAGGAAAAASAHNMWIRWGLLTRTI